MPRPVVPILPSPAAASRNFSSSRCNGKIKLAFSAIRRLWALTTTPCCASRAISSHSAQGSMTTPLPMTPSLPLRTTLDGSSDSLKVWLPITRVCPALCPPWKRTTISARSDSQSTILPLPSSPHWAPITTTFAMPGSLRARASALHARQPARYSAPGPRAKVMPFSTAPAPRRWARQSAGSVAQLNSLAGRPGHAIPEFHQPFLVRFEFHLPRQHPAPVVEIALARRRLAGEFDLDIGVLRHRQLVDHGHCDRTLVLIFKGDAEVADIRLGGRDDAAFAALLLKDGMADADMVVHAETEFVLFRRRQQRQLAGADKGAIAEQRHLTGKQRRAARDRHLSVEVSLLLALGHRTHRQRWIEFGLVDLNALGLAGRWHGDAPGNGIDRLEGLGLDRTLGFFRHHRRGALRGRLVHAVFVDEAVATDGLALLRRAHHATCRRSRRRPRLRCIRLKINDHRVELRRGRASARPRRRQGQLSGLPAFAAPLLDTGPAYEFKLGCLCLAARGKPCLVVRGPGGTGNLIANADFRFQGTLGVNE